MIAEEAEQLALEIIGVTMLYDAADRIAVAQVYATLAVSQRLGGIEASLDAHYGLI